MLLAYLVSLDLADGVSARQSAVGLRYARPKEAPIATADEEIDWPALLLELTGIDLRLCPRCQQPTLRRLLLTPSLHPARAPPRHQEAAA